MASSIFIEQLRQLGNTVVESGNNKICFDYTIPVGRLIGKNIKLGFVVADDFPFSPPSGPHVSPQLLPINPISGTHPYCGVHTSDFGNDWQYWSRPFNGWANTDRTVKTYMAYIRKLFETL